MPDWGSIALGTRLEKVVDSQFFVSWCHLVTTGLRSGDSYHMCQNAPAHMAANNIVREFLHSGRDTLCFLDSDALVDGMWLERFRTYEPGWEYDILQAFYTRRAWPPTPIWYAGDGAVRERDVTCEVEAVGTHCLLVRRVVFETLAGDDKDFNWFFYPREGGSEDVAFAREAKKAGFKMGATTGETSTLHLTTIPLGWETWLEFARLKENEAKSAKAI